MVIFLFGFAAIVLVLYAALIIFYRQCWLGINDFSAIDYQMVPFKTASTRLTIVIPARNEEATISRCLTAIIAQTYAENLFEVLVVDDHSTDNTAGMVQGFNKPNIRCIYLKDFVTDPINSYKKRAIEIAIEQATGELIITTDADCFMGPLWLQTMVAFYETYHPVFIAAPVLICNTNSFLSIFQTLDFMTLQGITGAAVNTNLHSMCNGANLAYTKAAFYAVDGFKNIDTIASGDDMLLMHKIFTRYPEKVLFLKSKEVVVQTRAMQSWKAFFNQRIRWASKAEQYNDTRILPVLMLVYFLNLFLVLLPVIAIFSRHTVLINGMRFTLFEGYFFLLAFKTIAELFFLYPLALFFNSTAILWWFPLAQPFHILYTVVAGWLGKFGSYQWKGRKVK